MKRKLFATASEIIEGYGLNNGKGAAKVVLRGRELKSGKVQMFLYSCNRGIVTRKAIGTLAPEINQEQKMANIESFRLAQARAGLENGNAIRIGHGFSPSLKSKVLFSDYISKLIERNTSSDGTATPTAEAYKKMKMRFDEFSGNRKITTGDLGRNLLVEFNEYLKNAKNLRNLKNGQRNISGRTQKIILSMFISAINLARRDGLTDFQPNGVLKRSETPKVEPSKREYLTPEEVQRLANTECIHHPEIKRAFLFCCFAGLRYSDVKRLTWNEIGSDANGVFVRMAMKKTNELITAYLSETALQIIGYKNGLKQDGKVFDIKTSCAYANYVLSKWVTDAGIKKHITFHCSRHTCATLLLNLGVPIEVVQKQLGHKNIATTQVYAKLLNKSISLQINKFDSLRINI